MCYAGRILVLTTFATVIVPVVLAADTLVLRNGQRVRGEIVSLRGGVIEFEEQRGFGRRTIRIDRREVARIELDDAEPGGDWGFEPGNGRPSGLRERTVQVSASTPWTDTGIVVRPGQVIFVDASGQVRWGRDRRDGPEGEDDSPFNPGRPIPNRPAAALIGRIDGSDDVFFIGAERGPIRMRRGGRLLLGINDDVLQDNSGAFRVVVSY